MSIILSGVSYRYRNQQFLFEGIDLSVAAGAKAAVVGDNGAGKSTLLKLIAGELAPAAGSIACSSHPYYVPQQLAAAGISAACVLGVADKLDALRAICGGTADPRCYDVLADDWDVEARCRAALDHWGLPHVGLTDPVDALSGGERTKLCLAGISVHNPPVILLDEPTNHLDMETREALTMALSTYEGAVLLVSHDRHLLRAVTDELWLVHEGRKEVFEGDLDDYAKIVLDHRRVTAAEARAEHQADKAARNEAQPVNNKEARRLAAQERARIAELRKPLKKELEKVEREMNALSEKLKALDTQLADPAFYNGADQGKVAQTLREHGELAPKVEALEMHWLELSEKIEALGTAASA